MERVDQAQVMMKNKRFYNAESIHTYQGVSNE